MDAYNNVYSFVAPDFAATELNNFCLHSTEKLLSLDFDTMKHIAFVAFWFSFFFFLIFKFKLI